jgi:hypothetical protein
MHDETAPTPWESLVEHAFGAGNGSRTSVRALRVAVRRLVLSEKAQGVPPEGVILSLWEALLRAVDAVVPPRGREFVRDLLFQWFLDAYYGPESARTGPGSAEGPTAHGAGTATGSPDRDVTVPRRRPGDGA